MITQRIKSGEYDVISTGSVISFKSEPITITLIDGKEKPLNFIFKFISDDSKDIFNIEFNLVNSNSLELSLNKFHIQGASNTNPIKVGHMEDRELYINFRVIISGEVEGKLLHYSFYLGKEREKNE